MNRTELVAFLRNHKLAVLATTAASGAPEAAVIGVVVNDDGDLFFDTSRASRKLPNLKRDPRVAVVVGWDDAQTAQLEGVADEPTGAPLEALKRRYFEAFPDGKDREAWPDIAYVRVRVTWARYSDFRNGEARVTEVVLA